MLITKRPNDRVKNAKNSQSDGGLYSEYRLLNDIVIKQIYARQRAIQLPEVVVADDLLYCVSGWSEVGSQADLPPPRGSNGVWTNTVSTVLLCD